ncbi:PREDICTED: uncharacterized protein LOC104594644 [Nelumbo nucifera]|uniref:Uncharacterized protein LOC104594644 n=2 Tax=Nelumbo nucifera TaxID=4432 RepID=A0A1U7ZXL4_NELNU|nr:PREDICTED: uncharacterized protein LOC104594644 [Nelumbo nucifera]DAD35731.1 TPA_asm: hypothetical protein HUJ06_006371 [Nelumbo nucifera]
MSQLLLFLSSLLVVASVVQRTQADGVQYAVENKAVGTAGGDRFAKEIGTQLSVRAMSSATKFIWKTFEETSKADRKDIEKVTLIVEVTDVALAYAIDGAIHLSEDFIAKYDGDLKTMFIGIIYHEMTHLWQWYGEGAPGGLIEGIADYVRYVAGYPAPDWAKPGQGDKWDEGYSVTARFLEYCNSLSDGFVAKLNAKMKNGYSDHLFVELLGKTVDQLWNDYKSKYSGGH